MDVVFLIGRLLFAAIFIAASMGHFKPESVEYARAKGGPAPELLVPASGAVILIAGLAMALGLWADLAALLLVAFLLPIALIMHAFWKETDPQAAQNEMAQFMKNISMAGGALIIFWTYNQGQDLPISLTDALFNPW